MHSLQFCPEWFNEWVIINTDEEPSWKLKPDAPDKVKKEFAEFMQEN
jgi:hypothetical protein